MPGSKSIQAAILFALFWIFALSQAASAQSTPSPLETAALFGTEHGDAYTSIFLNQLFGPLFPAVNGSTSTTVFSSIIGYFNIIMLVVGGMMFFYNITVGIMQSAHEGSVLGQRWSSLWAPIRVIFAVGLMVPVPGMGGYNLAQTGVAYIVKGSTNIASSIWGASAELVVRGVAPITADPAQIDPKIVATLFENAACRAIVNQQFVTATGGASGVGVITQTETSSDGTKSSVVSAVRSASGSVVNKNLCGSFTTPDLPNYITSISDGTAISGIPEGARAGIQTRFINAHQGSLVMLENSLTNIAVGLLPSAMDNGAAIPDISSQLISAWNDANANLETEIDALMALAVGADREGQASRDALLARIQGTCSEAASADASDPNNDSVKCYGEGWIGAGSWYMMLARLNNEIGSLTNAKASANTGNYIRMIGDGARDLYVASGGETNWWADNQQRAYDAGFASQDEAILWNARMMEAYSNSTAGLAALGFPMSTEHLGELNRNVDADNFLYKIPGYANMRTKIMEGILSFTSPGQWSSDPMIGLTKLGHLLINMAAVLIAVAFIGGFFTGGASATVMAPFISILLAAGSTLAFILPIMPFFFWVLAVTGYFLLIIEAVIAVNLWALGHMRMDGDGVSGEAGRMGWLMLLSLLMTPVLMVFGFLIGMSIFRITSALIDLGINQAISGIMGGGPFVEFGAILCFAVLICVLYITLLERSFSLVSEFPGRVLRWMGADSNITSGEENKVRMAAAGAAGSMYKAGAAPAGIAHRVGGKLGLSTQGDGSRGPDGNMTAGKTQQLWTNWRSGARKPKDGG
ncbi:DotA/TraY family protein [Epibacterium sp. DP7N7-1]|nr:DotA/TraY family protein [Epibacterium sp. DP7N7-1]